MSGTDVAVRQPAALAQQLSVEQVKFIANTEFVPRHLRGNIPAIFACLLYGRELGFGDMESLQTIYVVDGRPTMSAQAMVSKVRQAGHSIVGDATSARAVVRGKRADNDDELTVTFTMDDATQAGLAGKANYQKNPADMLWARAVSRLCRRLFSDALRGVGHVPEEAEMSEDERNLAVTDVLPLPPDDEDEAIEFGQETLDVVVEVED